MNNDSPTVLCDHPTIGRGEVRHVPPGHAAGHCPACGRLGVFPVQVTPGRFVRAVGLVSALFAIAGAASWVGFSIWGAA